MRTKIVITESEILGHPNDEALGKLVRTKYNDQLSGPVKETRKWLIKNPRIKIKYLK